MRTKHSLLAPPAETQAKTLQMGNELRKNLKELRESPTLKGVQKISINYDRLTGITAKLQKKYGAQDKLVLDLQNLLFDVAQEILYQSENSNQTSSFYRRYVKTYREIWREYFSLFILTASVFSGSLLIGWIIGTNNSVYTDLIIGQDLMERIIARKPWFDSQNIHPVFSGIMIAFNNIRVAFLTFFFSFFLGLGGILLLIYNGLHFGTIFGFCYRNQFHDQLGQFVLAHGPLELTIIVASSFTGLILGKAFFATNFEQIKMRLKKNAKKMSIVLFGVSQWLVLAAVLESSLSPLEISWEVKTAIGLIAAVAFWIWTFPLSSTQK